MKKITLYKIENDHLVYVGIFETDREIAEYLTEVKKLIDVKHQHQYSGEYIALPSLYYNIKVK